MREKRMIDLFDKLRKLDDKQLQLLDGAADSLILVQKLTELSRNKNMESLVALLG